mmetsp:Transcript_5327/g.7850  ORF Transcript_5327/g.7850 Transcript_5327/m.7850 type:complete len:494 (+) Transcript_5327:157-1638(+)|eukprot:CAMPEP_0167758744 /NCGR_PEP_ID=MMETSP0110_2-20121227/10636_1 /TAXON_ID=629695 /ORGANISM="Gymnochlora sp., Strain CCMP2014" /LENGTH=493 /DNA_ID=CAMNT_0007645049 /DNA_START=49 /DNA_END=1530 /DNA_ORIENTATION=-
MKAASIASALLVVCSEAIRLPNVQTHEGFSQITGIVEAGNSTKSIRFLGKFDDVDECSKACIALKDRCWSFSWYTDDRGDDFNKMCYAVTAPRLAPTPEEDVFSGIVEWPCRDDEDCSLNGVCSVEGKCNCNPAWSGNRCERLNLIPTTRHSGYRGVDDGHNTSSWGGAVLRSEDGTYHMWASEMTEHCGIGAWAENSRIIRATSKDPAGLYRREEVVYKVFSHEPEVVRGPNGEYVMFFTAQLRSEHGLCKCCEESSKCDGSTGPNDCNFEQLGRALDTDPSYMSYSINPEGPWSDPQIVFPDYVGTDTNFAPVIFPNGTLLAIWRTWKDYRGSRCHIAIGDNWKDTSTYKQYMFELFPDLGPAGTEDPFLYLDKEGNVHAIFHHMYGQNTQTQWWLLAEGGHAFSRDGVEWTYTGVAWGDPFARKLGDVVKYKDGSTFRFTRRERPHFILDDEGYPTHLITAAQYGTGKIPTEVGDNGDASYTLIQEIEHK